MRAYINCFLCCCTFVAIIAPHIVANYIHILCSYKQFTLDLCSYIYSIYKAEKPTVCHINKLLTITESAWIDIKLAYTMR